MVYQKMSTKCLQFNKNVKVSCASKMAILRYQLHIGIFSSFSLANKLTQLSTYFCGVINLQ